jgi:hypothetical protein
VVEEPFMTREAVLSVLRPAELPTERPFRTMREHGVASSGLPVHVRTAGGQIVGRIQLYSSLNADAARAYRLHRVELAREFAQCAVALEQSQPGRLIKEAIAAVAGHMPVDPSAPDAPFALRRYIGLRGRSTWRGLDRDALVREWLSHSDAWLIADSGGHEELMRAVVEMDRAACQVREDLLKGDELTATTFYGLVRRMDVTAAEIESADGQTLLIPRDDLERQGLAAIGQPVAVLREMLPGGGSYSVPMPAVALEAERMDDDLAPFGELDFMEVEDGSKVLAMELQRRDAEWLERELAREPTAIPAMPLQIT